MSAATDSQDEGMDLRDALRGVDPREFLPLIDGIRASPENMKKFVEMIATENPAVFYKYAKRIVNGFDAKYPTLDWNMIDTYNKSGHAIESIKYIRQAAGLGLKEAKQLNDERRQKLGCAGPYFGGPPPPTI